MQIKTKIVSCFTADSKPVKQEVNGTVILPPLVFPGQAFIKEVKKILKISIKGLKGRISIKVRTSVLSL